MPLIPMCVLSASRGGCVELQPWFGIRSTDVFCAPILR